MLGSVDALLMLGLAACWRWRDHSWRAGAALGGIVALKLVALPLIVWFVAHAALPRRRGRPRRLGRALRRGWAVIGFDGLTGYPHLLSLLTDIESKRGYSLVHYASAVGLGDGLAAAAPYAVGCCLLAVLCVVARRAPRADATMFLLGVLAVVAFSPIVWQHYLLLVLVPLAVLQPTLAAVWFVPLLLWLTPDSSNVPDRASS